MAFFADESKQLVLVDLAYGGFGNEIIQINNKLVFSKLNDKSKCSQNNSSVSLRAQKLLDYKFIQL